MLQTFFFIKPIVLQFCSLCCGQSYRGNPLQAISLQKKIHILSFFIPLCNLDTYRVYTNLIDPYDKWLWLSYGVSLLVISLVTLLIVRCHKAYLHSHKINPATDETFLMIRMVFGVTEPERLEFVDKARHLAGWKQNMSILIGSGVTFLYLLNCHTFRWRWKELLIFSYLKWLTEIAFS